MKSKKILGFIFGIIIYYLLVVVISGYGNIKNHPSINEFIIESFLQKYNTGKLTIDKFKNYMFVFDAEKLEGDAVTKPGMIHPNYPPSVTWVFSYSEEGKRQMNPKEWIIHGGYSADEPEGPACLRHFYDPTKPEGSRYLNDRVNAKLLAFAQTLVSNPQIDDVEWALGSENPKLGIEEHTYTWTNGKKWMAEALKEQDANKRKNLMAKAWRALGETLHMIADHGCPAHVRNDAHPSPFMNYNNYFGNPDPYEEYMAIIQDESQSEFTSFKNGKADQSLVTQLSQAKTAKEIADIFAIYTNKTFFTTETVSGTDWKGNKIQQITHPEWTYSSPKLENFNYSNFYYRGNIAGNEVLHLTDLWYFAKFLPFRTYPYLDKECVKSQAKILIPSIMEAGKELIKLFIPEIKVEITEAKSGKSLKGKITHIKDEEYKNQIIYNGKVKIKRLGSNFKEKESYDIIATNGNFEKTNLAADAGDLFIAQIEFGGVYVKSNEFKADEQTYSQNRVSVSIKLEGKYENLTSGNVVEYSFNPSVGNDFGETPLKYPVSWSGNNFSMSANHTWKKTDATENSQSTQNLNGSISMLNGKRVMSGTASVSYTTSENSTDVYGRKIIIRKAGNYAFSFTNIPDGSSSTSDPDILYFTFDGGYPLTQQNATLSKYEETITNEIIATGEKTVTNWKLKSVYNDKYGWVHIKFDFKK